MTNTARICVALAAVFTFSAAARAAAVVETGTLKGKTFLKCSGDDCPKRANLASQIKSEAKCSAKHDGKPVGSEDAITYSLESEGTKSITNVIVYFAEVKGDFDAPSEAAVINQDGCVYKPHITCLQVGQPLTVRNSDPVLHNINAQPAKNPPFNIGQPKEGMEENVTFKKAEIFKVKCDVHKWMGAWVGVFENPFFGVSERKSADDKNAYFEISNIPPGEYEVTAWHEVYGEMKQKITIKPGENELDFTFEAK